MARILLYRACPTASNGNSGKEVFWDTDLKQQITLSLTFAPSCSPFFIAPNTLLDTWCDGTTKKEVFSVWDGTGRPPRVEFTKTVDTLNSPTCGIQNACGLSITDVQITETALGVYSATVITTGSGSKFYTLTKGGTAGKSNVFPNLSAGTYTVYVSSFQVDANGRVTCTAERSFTIKNLRRARFYTDYLDNDGRQHRVEWLEEGYLGEPEFILSGDGATDIEYQGTGNKTDVLHGSGAVTLLVVRREGLLKDFYTADERKYKVNHLIDGQLNWTGWHMPDIYSEPWLALPYQAIVNAYDGIGGLDSMPYLNEAGERYYGRARAIEIIFRILRKLDLDLPVYLAVNVWEDTMDLNIEPLSQAYYDQELYYNEDNAPLSCKEVLEYILQGYNAFIRQSEAALHIIRYSEVKEAYRRRKADLGKGDSTIQFDLNSEEYLNEYRIERFGVVSYREASQQLNVKPAYKQVTSITEYGEYENFVLNGDFERWQGDKPLFWTGDAEVERILDGTKFLLGFKNPNGLGTLRNTAYTNNVQSAVGFTFKFDYSIAIEDFVEKPNMEWVVYPEFTVSGGSFSLINPVTAGAKATFNGVTRNFPNGTVTTVPVPANGKRTDIVYANPDGSITYRQGTTTLMNAPDLVILEPENSLLITYVTWENGEPHFSSTSSNLSVGFRLGFKIGNYPANVRASGNRNSSFNQDFNTEKRGNEAGWIASSTGTIAENNITFFHKNVTSDDGYLYIQGTCTIHTRPLNVPGVPTVSFGVPKINRDNLERVQIAIDNVVFQERQVSNIDKMLITGNNEGMINTPPFELTLHHGSNLPRVQALITLKDGTATKHWNNGQLLQQLVVQDILDQHAKPSHVLQADLDGAVTPLSVLIDLHLPGERFFIDKFIYHTKRGITSVEALQVFGGTGEEGGSSGDTDLLALLKDDNTLILIDDNGGYIAL